MVRLRLGQTNAPKCQHLSTKNTLGKMEDSAMVGDLLGGMLQGGGGALDLLAVNGQATALWEHDRGAQM